MEALWHYGQAMINGVQVAGYVHERPASWTSGTRLGIQEVMVQLPRKYHPWAISCLRAGVRAYRERDERRAA